MSIRHGYKVVQQSALPNFRTFDNERLLAFQRQWQFEGLYVADSALYSAENLQALTGLQWLTRVPLTLKAATDLVSTLPDAALDATGLRGYRIASVCSEYGGVRQRWFVVDSEARRQADLATLERHHRQSHCSGHRSGEAVAPTRVRL